MDLSTLGASDFKVSNGSSKGVEGLGLTIRVFGAHDIDMV